MNQKRKKGFTLIELLAVIVILAIIALIAVPIIMNIINKANKSAFKDTAYGVIQAGELYFAEQQLEPNGMSGDVTFDLPDTTKQLVLKGEVPKGTITITEEGKISIAVTNGRYCATKGLEERDVTITEDVENCTPGGSGGSNPGDTSELAVGDPVYFNPVENRLCDKNTEYVPGNSTTGVTDGCLRWYVYKQEDNKNYLILDHNTSVSTAFASEKDIGLVQIVQAGTNEFVPVTLFRQLSTDTKNWMVEPKIITIEELISLLPWYQNLDDKTNWQEKYMEQMELVQREVQENINPDDYETVAEANSAGVDYIISKGMAAPKYMYQDILDGFINENLIAYGYWTSSIDMTNQIVWAQMVYMTYPMDNSMITTFGVRPSIVLEDNQVSLKEKITELYAAESINVLVGETASAPIYTVPYYNSNGSMLNYVSDNESVATIDENGTIMGISPGVTTITVSTKDGSNISKTITVNVQELATDIEISTSSVSIMLGETYQIQAKVLPETATNKELSFSSYDSSIASVSNTGLITANSIGKTTIAVMTTDGTDIYKYIYVTVNPVTYVNNNMSSSNNCINEGICGVGTPINMKVNDNQSYLFYVISDTGTEVTMIMSHNLGTPVKWIDSTDYLSVNPAGCGDTSCNDYGPITALNYLNSLTSEWTNVPAIENYTYLNLSNSANQLAYQKLEIKNGEGILTADNDTTNVLKGISRARLLTYEETQISGIGCKTSYYSCPSWLYGNLNSSSPLGYWTLTTPESSLNNTVNIEYLGLINTIRYIYTDYIGVRPVITISK